MFAWKSTPVNRERLYLRTFVTILCHVWHQFWAVHLKHRRPNAAAAPHLQHAVHGKRNFLAIMPRTFPDFSDDLTDAFMISNDFTEASRLVTNISFELELFYAMRCPTDTPCCLIIYSVSSPSYHMHTHHIVRKKKKKFKWIPTQVRNMLAKRGFVGLKRHEIYLCVSIGRHDTNPASHWLIAPAQWGHHRAPLTCLILADWVHG